MICILCESWKCIRIIHAHTNQSLDLFISYMKQASYDSCGERAHAAHRQEKNKTKIEHKMCVSFRNLRIGLLPDGGFFLFRRWLLLCNCHPNQLSERRNWKLVQDNLFSSHLAPLQMDTIISTCSYHCIFLDIFQNKLDRQNHSRHDGRFVCVCGQKKKLQKIIQWCTQYGHSETKWQCMC